MAEETGDDVEALRQKVKSLEFALDDANRQAAQAAEAAEVSAE